VPNVNEITIQRIRKHKSDLEKDIRALVCSFEEETCCCVTDINMIDVWTIGGKHTIEDIVTEVKL